MDFCFLMVRFCITIGFEEFKNEGVWFYFSKKAR